MGRNPQIKFTTTLLLPPLKYICHEQAEVKLLKIECSPSFSVLGSHACLSKWSTIKLSSKPLENCIRTKVPSKMNLRTLVTDKN